MMEEKMVCKYEGCGRGLYDEEHCIFHSKDEGKADEFTDAFYQELEWQTKTKISFNFKGFIFPRDIDFSGKEFEKNASFLNACFEGNAYFRDAKFKRGVNFKGARFENRTDLTGAIFNRDSIFINTTFTKNTGFCYATFDGSVFFNKAIFETDVSFNKAMFKGDALFKSTFFGCITGFNYVIFEKVAYFDHSTFKGGVGFTKTIFKDHVIFNYTTFEENLSFAWASFEGDADFLETKFEILSMVDMSETYYSNVYFLLEILEANKKERQTSKARTEFLSENIQILLGDKSAGRFPIVDRQIADDRFLISFQKKHPKIHYLWWLLSDCGRSLGRWALWSLFFAVLFASLFQLFGPEAFKTKPEGYTWFSFIYYSIVTFTTLGFGDITPIKWYSEILVTLEVILGYIMLGGLISILANKLARRS